MVVWLGTALGAGQSWAASIHYVTFEFPAGPTGKDIWQYGYTLEVAPDEFNPDQGFAIEFDPTLYSSIESPSLGGWDIVVLQPDLELPAPGVFDALALFTLDQPAQFVISFEWLGGPEGPGSQPYSLYQLDDSGFVTVIGTGTTVPEPAFAMLLAAVAGGLAARRARARRREGLS
jgi:hypothetical protein